MALDNFDNLNEIHIDVLRELGNIGSGNAASSLSQMLGQRIDIAIPNISILGYNEAINDIGGAETQIVGLLLTLKGDVEGMMMFLLHQEFAALILNSLMGMDIQGFEEIDEMGYSAIQEMSNIMAGSFVNAISEMTGLTIDISPPSITIDMLGAIMSVPAIYYADISDKIIFIKNEFSGVGQKAPAHIMLMPDVPSLEQIMTRLGIEI